MDKQLKTSILEAGIVYLSAKETADQRKEDQRRAGDRVLELLKTAGKRRVKGPVRGDYVITVAKGVRRTASVVDYGQLRAVLDKHELLERVQSIVIDEKKLDELLHDDTLADDVIESIAACVKVKKTPYPVVRAPQP